MLTALYELQDSLNKLLDTFFHLPTLIIIAVVILGILWQIYGVGLNLGDGFIRLNSSQGSITLHWIGGCCELEW